MIKSEDLFLIWTLDQEKSLAATARSMHLTPSAISQRLSALEGRLGLKLAQRNGRSGVTLTSDGELLASTAADVISRMRALEDQMGDREGGLRGKLKIVAPLGFGRNHVGPVVAAFRKLHPNLNMELKLTDDIGGLPTILWDIVIKVNEHQASLAGTTHLMENKRVICASPAYMEMSGPLSIPEELSEHRTIAISEDSSRGTFWKLHSPSHGNTTIRLTPVLTTNDGEAAVDWALQGHGLLLRSRWSVAKHLAAGTLVEVLAGWSGPDAPIVAMTASNGCEPEKVSAFLLYLETELHRAFSV